MGLTTCATLSDGQEIATPRFFRREEHALAKAHRRLSTEEMGTPKRARRRKVVARAQERIAWRRSDFAQQHSRRSAKHFDLLTVAELSVHRMVHQPCLAKSIHDVAWSQFARLLAYKAAGAGRKEVAVNPADTRQECSQCRHRKTDLTHADRSSTCSCCGIVLDRDRNASLNILRLGQQSLASA